VSTFDVFGKVFKSLVNTWFSTVEAFIFNVFLVIVVDFGDSAIFCVVNNTSSDGEEGKNDRENNNDLGA